MFAKASRHRRGVYYFEEQEITRLDNKVQIMKATFPHPQKILAIIAGAVLLTGATMAFTQKNAAATTSIIPVDERPVEREPNGRNSFSPVVKKVAPGVVKVSTVTKVRNASLSGNPGAEDMFRHFFDGQSDDQMPKRSLRTPRQEGLGSGVIVTKDGYILTNNHVVDGADDVKVTLPDGREFAAKVIGCDPKTDVAVIKIEAKDLPTVSMADSDQVEIGDVVLAIGNPFGIGQTVTTGIVSAKDRGSMGLDYEDFIQTDAAINPGNSGGALVDADGRLIGINTAILSRSGGNQGIGFAIPANLARVVMTSLIKDGRVTRGYLGVMIQDLTPALAKEFKLKDASGVLVGDVTARGPADIAGLKSGDVVMEFNGKKAADSRRLKLQVAGTRPGENVAVKILRDNAEKTLNVTVKELPGSEDVATADAETKDSRTLNGVGVADLDDNVREQFKVPGAVQGAMVTEVQPDSAAAEAGLKPGDVIQEINREPVKNSRQAVRLTENPKDKTTLLRIWRDGGSHFVVVDESKAG
jgi:serine protease Do